MAGSRAQVLVGEEWFTWPTRQKELATDALTKVWWNARRDAGFTGNDVAVWIVLRDSTDGRVAEWSIWSGVQVHR